MVAKPRCGLAALAFLVCALPAMPVRAQDEAPAEVSDYDDTSDRWNGLQTLTAVARGMGLRVDVVENLEWDELEAGDVLFVVYPTRRLDPSHVAAFIRNGGRMLLADDFGESTEAMGRLGMLRKEAAGVAAQRFYRDLPFAPVAVPVAPEHALAAGVDELVTNHPAVLVQVRGPEIVFEFAPGEAVVTAGTLGTGRFVVVSDPSVFINRMLQFEGNLQFAINAVRYLTGAPAGSQGGGRLIILTGEFSVYGEPSGVLDDGTVRGTMAHMLSELNRWLDELNDYLLTMPGMRVVAVLIAGLIGLAALLVLPLVRKLKLDGDWTRARSGAREPEDFDALVRRHERGGHSTNYLLLATILRDTVNQCLARTIEVPDPLYGLREGEIAEALTRTRGRAAAAAFRRLSRPLASLPTRMQAASRWSTGYVSRRDFERLHEDALELYLALGEEPPG